MAYLLRTTHTPDAREALPEHEAEVILAIFYITPDYVQIDGEPVYWDEIKEVEVVSAARAKGPAGWLVRHVVHGNTETYHIGIYCRRHEAVVRNVSLNMARYVVQSIAYYANGPVKYSGVPGLSPLTGVDED